MLKRKIAFYMGSDCYGGMEKNVLHFMEWLTSENNEVILLSSENYTITKIAIERAITIIFTDKTKGYNNVKKAWQLSRTLRKNHICFMFIIRPRDILVAALTKIFFYRILNLIFIQQSILRLKKHPYLYSLLFRPINAWITPSNYLRDQAIEMTRYKPAQLLVIPPCIDIEYYVNDILTKKAARKLLELPQEKVILGSIGHYNLKHKQDFLIRVIQLLHRHNYDVDLLIMGKTSSNEEIEYYSFLKNLAKECQVEMYVHFRPYSEKIITFFRALDYFIMNWSGEPYDMVIVKAMASGVPVIARYSDYNTELLENGKYGLLFRAGNLEDLSSKIIHLLTQNRLVSHLRQESMNLVREKFDKKIGCQKVEELINNLHYKL